MLTGIRIGVPYSHAKFKRPLTDDDLTAAHKFSFDVIGNECTPSAKYDFKFQDYAPWVFRLLREDHFALDPADYLVSLAEKYTFVRVGLPPQIWLVHPLLAGLPLYYQNHSSHRTQVPP